ncbi:MAG: low-specificity L-threonine aldolase [Myxococcota bacterium]|nr:low-specificity L-threonine aldolase [Myxococcota bacterium]
MLRKLDLRSDTVTKPTAAMRKTMAEAPVGDDVYGEDPSVNALQESAARLLGKEAALFFPTGTMANQACLRALTHPGDVVIASEDCHILKYESGAASAVSGVQIKTVGHAGLFAGDEVRSALHPDDAHFAPTTLLAVENTHNASGGRVFPQELLGESIAVALEAGLALHLDGARLWNAHVASGTPLVELAEPFDTVSVCLSKGLGAPVGSVVCASGQLITRLHRIRKMLGGGMRQAGMLAAAGRYAIENHLERLAEDHDNARQLAEGLKRLGFGVEEMPETNIVVFDVPDGRRFLEETRKRSLWINPISTQRFRAVTHLDVSSADIQEALERIIEADLVA